MISYIVILFLAAITFTSILLVANNIVCKYLSVKDDTNYKQLNCIHYFTEWHDPANKQQYVRYCTKCKLFERMEDV